MIEFLNNSLFFGLLLSLATYALGCFLKSKLKTDLVNPLIISVILVIVFIVVTGMDFESYKQQSSLLSYMLTPVTVCLAVPLYKQLNALKQNLWAVCIGITVGVITALTSVLLLSLAFGVSHELYVTLLPKSITTAIGMGVSEELGGITEITVAVIVITGVIGAAIGRPIMKLFRITEPVAVGLALGTASHAVGTSKAIEIGETEGAMSGLAIVVAGILTVILAPFFAMII